MRLSLSTAAAPELGLDELLDACARRGLRGLELVAGHAHGVGLASDPASLESVRRLLVEAGVDAVAVRVDEPEAAISSDAARVSAALDAPILLSTAGVASLAAPSALRERAARAADLFATWGAALLLEHGSDPAHVAALHALVEAEGPGTLGLAWDADPADPRFIDSAGEVLVAAGAALEHIRLRGGGPESAMQEGQGIGSLMARLTLAGYTGSIAVSPSTSRYRVAWEAWLGRRGWGCGSKASDDSLVALEPLTLSQGGGS